VKDGQCLLREASRAVGSSGEFSNKGTCYFCILQDSLQQPLQGNRRNETRKTAWHMLQEKADRNLD
jgi:hypothetical protein